MRPSALATALARQPFEGGAERDMGVLLREHRDELLAEDLIVHGNLREAVSQ
jgi:hypothetical protein